MGWGLVDRVGEMKNMASAARRRMLCPYMKNAAFCFFVNRPKKSSLYDVIENIITFVLNAIMMNIVKSMFLWAPWSVENCWSNSPSLHDISRRGNNGVSWYPRYQKIFWLKENFNWDYRYFVVNIALMEEMQLFCCKNGFVGNISFQKFSWEG